MITRRNVAEHAGVSKTTVSRVINNVGYVSRENREKVEAAIKALGYKPNLIARSLKTKETRQILFYATELINPFYMEVYKGMEDYAEELGYTIVVSRHYNSDIILQRQFDGIILSDVPSKYTEDLLTLNLPVVVTSYTNSPVPFPSVNIDIEDGALKAMDYLTGCGHRDIAFITGPNTSYGDRYNGYKKGLHQMSIPFDPERIISDSGKISAYEQGYRSGLKLIQSGIKASAVFAFNDAMAIGAMSAFYQKGIKVPEDISVMGFDDILQSRYTCPPLSTIYMPKYEQGRESANILLKLIKNEKAESMTLKTHLIVRESVAKL